VKLKDILPVLWIRVCCLLLMLFGAFTPLSAEWPAPVEGFQAPAAGEHPRLLFRKEQVPALRAKTKTPEGRTILNRLMTLLGGGKSMPTVYNQNAPVNIGPQGPGSLPVGAFTLHHAAGFGLLYQLSGEERYADLSWQCVEKILAGQVDRDERYSWNEPGTGFRLGGVLQALALAYDLSYDAWSPAQRQKVIDEIQGMKKNAIQGNRVYTLESMAAGGNYPPSSNHFGAYVSGAGLAALALRGDPGTDSAKMEKVLSTTEVSLKKLWTHAFGDAGWFGEGTGSDKTAMFPGAASYIQAARISQGKDWAEGAPNARMAILTRALELINAEDGVKKPQRGLYAHGEYFWPGASRDRFADRGGWSKDGLFAIGMGALPEADRPAMKWLYENFVEPGVSPEQRIYGARIDPLHAVYAFVNWPVGEPAVTPESQFPLTVYDRVHGYVLSRNRFQDEQDILFTGLSRTGPTGYHKTRASRDARILFDGYKIGVGRFSGDGVQVLEQASDGSLQLRSGGSSWALDFSGAAGCAGLIVFSGDRGPSVQAPRGPGEAVADEEIDLSGTWTDGSTIKVVQNGHDLNVTFIKGSKRREKTATLEGRKLKLLWSPKNNKVLTGTVSEDGSKVHWDGGAWERVKKERWAYRPGETVKTRSVMLGNQKLFVVTLAEDGKHPESKVEGGLLRVGGQQVEWSNGQLRLKDFQAMPR